MSSVVPRCLGSLALSAAVLAWLVPASWAAGTPEGWRPFSPDSIWNLPLRSDAPLDPASATYVEWLGGRVAASGGYINTTSCGMPIYWADPDTPRVAVALDPSAYQDRVLIAAWSSVPIPADAKVSNCSDKNFAVLQTQPDGTVRMWEFWAATKRADGTWTARWGGATQDVQADRGIASKLAWTDPTATVSWLSTSSVSWNVTATSISMVAGVITNEEMLRGSIDHAVAMATTDAAASRWTWPAQRTDGGSTDPAAIPEGARLRLDPALDVEALAMTPLVRMIARAAQRYGIVVRDRTWGANVFYAEEPHAGETSPVKALLDGQWPNAALNAFPWSRLQVVTGQGCSTTPCLAEARAVIDVDTATPRVGEPVALDTSRSVLEQPRAAVEWDLDGDGSYETAAGRATTVSFTPANAGPLAVGLRLTGRDGAVVTGTRTVDIAAPRSPVVRRPSAALGRYFYAYSSAYTLLTSVTATTQPPTVPDRFRRAYTTNISGSLDMSFTDEREPSAGDATLQAWLDCSGARCLRLAVRDAAGSTLAALDVPYNTSGWVTLRVPGPFTAAQADALELRTTARNLSTATGNARIGAVSLTAGWRGSS